MCRGAVIVGAMSAIWAAPGPTGKFFFVLLIGCPRESLNQNTNICAIRM